MFDPVESKRFIDKLQSTPERKHDLENLYKLSNNVHSHKICAPDNETLDNINRNMDKKGFIYKGKVKG